MKPLLWLTTALAAVASTVVAGSQLSSIGSLNWEDDGPRLVTAVVSIVVALGCVLVSLWLLTWAQMPGKASDLSVLRSLTSSSDSVDRRVVALVDRDSSFNRGTQGLDSLLAALDAARAAFYRTSSTVSTLAERAAEAKDDAEQLALTAELERMRELRSVYRDRMDNYRLGAQTTSFLRSHLLTQRRTGIARTVVVVLSLVAALALVTFAWAANPGTEESQTDAVVARPVSARLFLSSTQEVWSTRLGAACVIAARSGVGIPVVALSSSKDGVEVVTVPTSDCPSPTKATVPTDDGTVRASTTVLP